jgi:hypothetical protein
MEPRRVSASDLGRIVGELASAITVMQRGGTRLWLLDQAEPFCEVDLVDGGRVVALRFSVHSSPAWAALVTAALARHADVAVAPQGFIQDHRGYVRYDADAEAYWAYHRRIVPLLTARFTPQPN